MKKFLFTIIIQVVFVYCLIAQNIGIGINTPQAKLHIKGSADTSQLVIDANSTQLNTHPLIRLRSAAGVDLVHIHSDHTTNTFLGLNSGRVNNAGGGALGNTFIGSQSGASNLTGASLTGIGTYSLLNNIAGKENTAVGPSTLYYNTFGSYNTAMGRGALFQNINTDNNTAIGFKSLFSNIGVNNTAIGSQSLISNTNGQENTASGVKSLAANTTGGYNSASGSLSLTNNIDGSLNTANGYYSLYSNTSGYNNTATGVVSLANNITGHDNTAVGLDALSTNNWGNNNTAIGSFALSKNIGGDNNIAIGYKSGNRDPFISNSIGIGNDGSFLIQNDNQVIIGNSSTAQIGGKVNWGVISDARVKNTITEDVKGLKFIMKLRPVTYHISNKAIARLTGAKESEDIPGKNDGEKIKYTGFLAQEVERAAIASDYDFSGYTKPANAEQFYTLRYAEFVVPLVKAVQDQQAIITSQQKQIDDLKKITSKMTMQLGLLTAKH